MTFDEMHKIIWGNTLGVDVSGEYGMNDFLIKCDGVATGREALNFFNNELKDTYAPTIEMTELQVAQMMSFKEANVGFGTFIYKQGLGEVPAFEGWIQQDREDELMQAWLHPECVKVVE